jgi:N-succinyldiaminopimelate aminotransferase
MQFTGNRLASTRGILDGALSYNATLQTADKSSVNPDLARLQPYPFEKLRHLFAGVAPAPSFREIKLSIGEPQHPTPPFIQRALADNLAGLANYPTTQGSDALRQAIAAWIARRYLVPVPDFMTQVVPVNGSREALFAFAQTVIYRSRSGAKVVCPNPFYQIYEGAALLAGAEPVFLNTVPHNDFEMDWAALPESTWRDVQLVYVCSPANPTGKVMDLAAWKTLFELSDRHGFVIASDECYSEIYFDEAKPPLGGLTAAAQLGRHDYRNLVTFSSLSKRSNVPGLRSGFVAGDAAILKKFLLYRTYHGGAMNPAVQAASIAAWNDEAHVRDNRRMYAEKFHEMTPLVARHLDCRIPDAGFYLWAKNPDRRYRLRPRAAAAKERRGAARQLPCARGQRHQPGRRFHPHRAGRQPRGMPRRGAADQRFLSLLVTPMASKATLES